MKTPDTWPPEALDPEYGNTPLLHRLPPTGKTVCFNVPENGYFYGTLLSRSPVRVRIEETGGEIEVTNLSAASWRERNPHPAPKL